MTSKPKSSGDGSSSTDKELMPFVIYQNSLEMFSRVMKSTCDLSIAILESSKRSEEQVAKALSHETPAQAFAEGMIPTTDEMDHAAKVVASAMNDAATRALSAVNNEEKDAKAPAAAAPQKPSAPSAPRLPKSVVKSASKPAAGRTTAKLA